MVTTDKCLKNSNGNSGLSLSGKKGGAGYGFGEAVEMRQPKRHPNPRVMALLERNIKEKAGTWRALANF